MTTSTKAGPTDTARSEDELFAPGGPTITLRLGGIDKRVRELPVRKNEEWKRQLAAAASSRFRGLGVVNSAESIAKIFSGVQDVQVELLVAYDVDGRLGGVDWIEEHAVPSEIWEAFKGVILAAFPPLADAKNFPNLVAELLPQLVALLSSKPSTNGTEDSTN